MSTPRELLRKLRFIPQNKYKTAALRAINTAKTINQNTTTYAEVMELARYNIALAISFAKQQASEAMAINVHVEPPRRSL